MKVVNLRIEPYDEYIGRGSEFGNLYSHKKGTKAKYLVNTREEAIILYKRYFLRRIDSDRAFRRSVLKLRGKVLGCYCSPAPCHGDVIVEWLEQHPDLE